MVETEEFTRKVNLVYFISVGEQTVVKDGAFQYTGNIRWGRRDGDLLLSFLTNKGRFKPTTNGTQN